MSLSYSLATGADLTFVKELNEKLLPDNYDWHTWWHLRDNATIYLVKDIGRIIGYVVATWDTWPVAGPYIFSLAVLPEYRRRGVATQLIQLVWDHPKRQSRPLQLHCRASNVDAQALYRKNGFVLMERMADDTYPTPTGREGGFVYQRN